MGWRNSLEHRFSMQLALDEGNEMPKPEMKQESELTLADFLRHPIWIGVHNYDVDEPWYEESDEETVRPWTGQLPFAETRGTALVAARFLLADGSVYPGYCCAVANDWDKPQVPVSGAPQAKALSWSAMHGGVALSILLLQSPTIFVGGRSFDFQLRVPELRRGYIREFYSALGKSPTDVFPIQFKAESGLASGIVSGTVDGFFNFPLHDGNVYQGYVRAVPENWADIDPSPTLLGGGHVIQGSSPRKRFGGSPLAVVGEHQPCLFIGNRKFFFWCGPRCDLDELRHS